MSTTCCFDGFIGQYEALAAKHPMSMPCACCLAYILQDILPCTTSDQPQGGGVLGLANTGAVS